MRLIRSDNNSVNAYPSQIPTFHKDKVKPNWYPRSQGQFHPTPRESFHPTASGKDVRRSLVSGNFRVRRGWQGIRGWTCYDGLRLFQ